MESDGVPASFSNMRNPTFLGIICILTFLSGIFLFTDNAQASRTIYEQIDDSGGSFVVGDFATDVYNFVAPFEVATGTEMIAYATEFKPTNDSCGNLGSGNYLAWSILDADDKTVVTAGLGSITQTFVNGSWVSVAPGTSLTFARSLHEGETYTFSNYINCGGGTGEVRMNTGDTDLFGFFVVDDLVTDLTIDYPINNATVNDFPVIPISGTCTAPLSLSIYDGTSTSTALYLVESSVNCNSNAWTFPLLAPQGGFYNVFATSTDATAGIIFQYIAQSFDVNFPTTTATFTNPFQDIDTEEFGFFGFLYDYQQEAFGFEPFIYVPQIVFAFWDGFNNASTTNWIDDVEIPIAGAGTFTVPGITVSLFDDIDEDFKTNTRTVSTLVWYAVFVFYLWRVAHRFV